MLVLIQLGPQALDMRINSTAVTEIIITPNAVQQIIAAENLRGIFRQRPQKLDFLFCPGVGHKKKANRTNGTGRKQYGHIQGKKIQTEKRQRKGYKKNNGTVKEQTHKKGERRQAARKTRSKPQPDKPVKGRRTLY